MSPMKDVKERRYWRSLAQRNGDDSVSQWTEREFPEGASELPSGVSRREMLTLMGASVTLAGLAACRRPVETIVPYVKAPEQIVPGIPQFYATTMPFGTSAYGLIVESHGARPTKIEGNEEHPTTRGASSSFAQASMLSLYDPDRSKSTLEEGERTSWDAFVAAWKELDSQLASRGGRGLALVTESYSSPTLTALMARMRERFPNARVVTYEPLSDERIVAGVEAATGAQLQPMLHLDRAKVVVALDADPLNDHPESVRHMRDFADARRVASEADGMNRLYAAEPGFTITGGMADHRLAIRSSEIAGLVDALGAGLGLWTASLPSTADAAWVAAAVADLRSHGGSSLVVAGPGQPAGVHAAVAAINSALGNDGQTISYHRREHATMSSTKDLSDLVTAMNGGEVETLVMLGNNLAYSAPSDLRFESAMGSVANVIHLSSHVDETSSKASWHVPRAHYLESWGDARALGGAIGLIQPLIAPLYNGKSDVELLNLLATGEDKSGYDVVRETWQQNGTDDKAWRNLLHEGVTTASETSGESVSADAAAAHAALVGSVSEVEHHEDGLEISFGSSALYDGRFANNGWLQELPDPITKITWGNAALISAATAKKLGVENEDPVTVAHGGGVVSLPAWIMPGQVDGTVIVALGYGRTAAGRVGNGVGGNAFRMRASETPGFGHNAVITAPYTRSDGEFDVACTQDHGSMEGRPIVREASLEEFRADPKFATRVDEHHPPLKQPFADHDYSKGHQWGMTIDLNVCTGCGTCVVACQSENNIPVVGKDQVRRGREMHWLRIDRYFVDPSAADHGHGGHGGGHGDGHGDDHGDHNGHSNGYANGDAGPEHDDHDDHGHGDHGHGHEDHGAPSDGLVDSPEHFANPQMVFQPVPCMHCENAPCEQVCPVAATVHDEEGLNSMVYNRCIGTRYCANNCPYKVRRFNFYAFTKDTPEVQKLGMNPDVTVRSRGVMEKCTYCTQRINARKIDAKLQGRDLQDGEIKTACQQACPTQAIAFGDILDPKSEVMQRKGETRNYVMLGELNNRPRTSYLAKIRNPNPGVA